MRSNTFESSISPRFGALASWSETLSLKSSQLPAAPPIAPNR
jgi:hypothetical protein